MTLANATIGQLMIPIDDLGKGVALYRDVLGLPFLFAAPPQMAFFICGKMKLPSIPPNPNRHENHSPLIHGT